MNRIAVMDIGTNSTRLLVAEVDNRGVINTLHTDLSTTRLGEGMGGALLTEAAMERTVKTLGSFLEEARRWWVERVVAAATSAVRDARNRETFLKRVLDQTGIEIEVLSGYQEALCSYAGAMSGMDIASTDAVVMDVGGGSTEFIWHDGMGLECRSLDVGAVRVTEGGHSDAEIGAMMEPVWRQVPSGATRALIGVGGTVTTLAAMDQELKTYDSARVHGYILTVARIEGIMKVLMKSSLEQRKLLPGLQPQRADIIPAGVRIVRLAMLGLGISTLRVSDTDILHGLALRALHPVERKPV